MRKICFITGTRAEYGLMNRLMKMVKNDLELHIQVVATNMHLSPEFGLTYKEIENDGFFIDKKIEMLLSADTPTSISKSLGVELISIADAYQELKPDLVVLLGDRYEILGAAISALFFNIPVAHISGGDVTEGAYDDAIRHSITKMSHFHFVSTAEYRRRVIQLGENPQTVYNVGSLAVDNIRNTKLLNKIEFEESIQFKLAAKNVLITFHPQTLGSASVEKQFFSLLEAVDSFDCNIIFTKPNSDSNGRVISYLIDDYVSKNSERSVSFVSLGYLKYLSSLQFMDVIIGNSSSGIVEVPSFHIPTVNIGDRQKGRLQSLSVINCMPDADSIKKALSKAFSDEFRKQILGLTNPYEQENTADKIYHIIRNIPLEKVIQKHFFDLK